MLANKAEPQKGTKSAQSKTGYFKSFGHYRKSNFISRNTFPNRDGSIKLFQTGHD